MTVNLRTIADDPAADARRATLPRCSRSAARSTCRSAASGELNERARRRAGEKLDARTRATPPPARCGRRTRRSPRRDRSRPGPTGSAAATGSSSATHWETLAWLREHGFRDEPLRRAARVDRGGRRGLRGLGAAAARARLRDRRDRDQGRLARPAGGARSAPLAAALGARLQVGADDRRDDAARRSRSGSGAPARSTRGRCSSRSRSAASPSRARRCTTRRTSTARRSARATA